MKDTPPNAPKPPAGSLPMPNLPDLQHSVRVNRLMIETQFQMAYGSAMQADKVSQDKIANSWKLWREAEGIPDVLTENSGPCKTASPPPLNWNTVAWLALAMAASLCLHLVFL